VETENDKLRRQLDQAQRTIEQLKLTAPATTDNTAASSILIPMEGSEHNDDSTVVSNATTVKASGKKRNEKHPSTPTKEDKLALESPPSTPATVASDSTTSSSRRIAQFLKRGERLVVWKRTEPKMSDAALELSDLQYASTSTPARRRVGGRELTQQELSLTMERYLYRDTTSSTNSCGTLAEF
jgi:hypothetical protein